MDEWSNFYNQVNWFPWSRMKFLLARKQPDPELDALLLRYKCLKADSLLNAPLGPELLRHKDTVAALHDAPDEAQSVSDCAFLGNEDGTNDMPLAV